MTVLDPQDLYEWEPKGLAVVDIFFHGADEASASVVPLCSAKNMGTPL